MKQARVYFRRGHVERWVPSRRRYEWREAYSPNSAEGLPTAPWSTYRECQAEAKADGVRAVFEKGAGQ